MSASHETADAARNAPIFVGGAGRSGTTLLRVILDSHSRIACGPELKVIPSIAYLWADFQTKYAPFLASSQVGAGDIDRLFRDLISGLLAPLRAREGKPRSAEKSPNNVFFFRHLHQIFPDATFIHVLRDGRDVVASLLQMDWKTPDGIPIDYTRDPRLGARYWANAVMTGREFARQTAGSSRYFEVRYEELVERPEACLRPLFEYLGEPWEPDVLSFHQRSHELSDESSADQVTKPLSRGSVGRWRNDLTPTDLAAIKHEAGGLLRDLGYVRDMNW
ncbi:MAG: sulfotransferase [Burkholderiales bacterium]